MKKTSSSSFLAPASGLLNRIHGFAEQTPNNVALKIGNKEISYEQLWMNSGEVLDKLIAAGVEPGHVVLVQGSRTTSLFIHMVAVLRLDSCYCIDELDSGAAIELDSNTSIFDFVVRVRDSSTSVIKTQSRPTRINSTVQAETACVVLTSGSTGFPKAVSVKHSSIDHYCDAVREKMAIKSRLRFGHVSSLEADLGNTSIFLAWWTGGTLCVADEETRRDPLKFWSWLNEHNVDVLKITPSHWHSMLAFAAPELVGKVRLKHLILGGEKLSITLAQSTAMSGCAHQIWNHYGPCETTIGVAMNKVLDVERLIEQGHESVPLGQPLGRTKFRVLRDNELKKTGVGELIVSGPGVSDGYLNDVEETNKKFFVSSALGTGRAYKTGDLVDISEDGDLIFLGRIDRQVKIDGRRVQLEQLEQIYSKALGTANVACIMLSKQLGDRIGVAVLSHDKCKNAHETRSILASTIDRRYLPSIVECLTSWPVTENGKTDYAAIRELLKRSDETNVDLRTSDTDSVTRFSDPLFALIHKVWKQILGVDEIGIEEDFFHLGGTSLDAIKMIGMLQRKGLATSATTFLEQPSIMGLVHAIQCSTPSTTGSTQNRDQHLPTKITPILESWISDDGIVDHNHWNQSCLIQIEGGISPADLTTAVLRLINRHSMLLSRITNDSGNWQLVATPAKSQICGNSYLASANIPEIASLLEQACSWLHQSIDIWSGKTFGVHLFSTANKSQFIHIVAHHAVVDAISWHIIIEELLEYLHDRTGSSADDAFEAQHNLADAWLIELSEQRKNSDQEIMEYLQDCSRGAVSVIPYEPSRASESGTMSDWMKFTVEETRRLKSKCLNSERTMHQILIAAFCHTCFEQSENSRGWIEIEGHGRVRESANVDISQCVGWFTTPYPILVSPVGAEFCDTLNSVADALLSVPQAVKECGVFPDDYSRTASRRPQFLFNFLGEFDLREDHPLRPRFADFHPGVARGAPNSRPHALTFTARIINGALAVDCTYSPNELETHFVNRVLTNFRSHLCDWMGSQSRKKEVTPTKNASGALWYAPPSVKVANNPPSIGDQSVLLTGVTGFVGAHLAGELRRRGIAPVHCLIRASSDLHAEERLRFALNWYEQLDTNDLSDGSFVAHAGDISRPHLGMAPEKYEKMKTAVAAVYNCAADVRLFASLKDIRSVNVRGVENLIQFATDIGHAEFYQISTLSVAGSGKPSGFLFDESTSSNDCEFRNSYEQSKSEAEELVKIYGMTGARTQIYRLGNVSAHSQTGRFQLNAMENQIVQLMKAHSGSFAQKIGADLHLSPVDTVTAGIVSLSNDKAISSGTFHVDSPHSYPFEQILAPLPNLRATSSVNGNDVYSDLANFWTNRKAPQLRFSRSRTLALLKHRNVQFHRLSSDWFEKFAKHLLDHGVFSPSSNPASEPPFQPSSVGS